jgi:aminoglycoside 6'-N-acetyltransferase
MDELRGTQILLRPIGPSDASRLREIHATAAVAAWWGTPEPEFPSSDDPDVTRFTIRFGDEVAGMVQFSEETEPDYRHASVDMFVAPELHGQGLGTDALSTLARYLMVERGHHRITIDPAADNQAAIRCYEKAGFRRIGVMRWAERGPAGTWHDVLLMELVKPPPTG